MYELPTSITIDGRDFAITNKGDFRMVLDCFATLEDSELSRQERLIACLLIFYQDINEYEDLNSIPDLQEAVNKMYLFFNCNQQQVGAHTNYKLIDWENDAQIIMSAINKVAGKEVRLEEYVHWWTFMGYYCAVGESALSTIVSIRSKIAKGVKLEKYEQKFRQENPQYFTWDARTIEQKEADELVKNIWNSGG